MKSIKYLFLYIVVLTVPFGSCKKFIEIDLPNTQITRGTVFQTDETAIAAATGMYRTMANSGNIIGGTFSPISYLGGISSDELVDRTGTVPYVEFYDNEIQVHNSAISGRWNIIYNTIYEANAVLEGIAGSSSLSADVKKQLEGEAKFVRAFYYFYLVNLFGDVPLALSTDYQVNAKLSRSPVSEVYDQITSDLKDAQQLLTENYFNGTKRIRPNKHSATALLARVYLFLKDYANAEAEASKVISSPAYKLETNLNNVFLANNNEAILQLSQVYPYGLPTGDASRLLIVNDFFPSALRPDVVNSFQPGDLRRTSWINSYPASSGQVFFYPYKYKVRIYVTDANYPEFLVLLRLAEQYLIRAEARAQSNNISGAQADINIIRARAFGGPNPTTANDKASLLSAIENERRFELLCEMGHRWLDLKRTNRAEAVLSPLKPNFKPTDVLYPIPEAELSKNPNLTQNAGY